MKNKKIFLYVSIIVIVGLIFIAYQKQEVDQNASKNPTNASLDKNPNENIVGVWKVLSVVENGKNLSINEAGAIIKFSSDGTCNTTGGCNSTIGCRYNIETDNKLKMSLGSTKKLCPQTNLFEFGRLSGFNSFSLNQDRLTINYESENGTSGFFDLQKLEE